MCEHSHFLNHSLNRMLTVLKTDNRVLTETVLGLWPIHCIIMFNELKSQDILKNIN